MKAKYFKCDRYGGRAKDKENNRVREELRQKSEGRKEDTVVATKGRGRMKKMSKKI